MSQLSPELQAEGERLILDAFSVARERGHLDWRRMRSAVLKNRLLDLTSGEFDERRWQTPTFRHFLALFPTLISVDATQRPPIVELLRDAVDSGSGQAVSASKRAFSSRERIRPDLWRAILDYSSGAKYVWDADSGLAEPVGPNEHDPRPTLPTIDQDTLAAWRGEFATEQLGIVPANQKDVIEGWRDPSLPTSYLPARLRGIWNGELKRHVLELLEAWYSENDLPLPDDVLVERPERGAPAVGDAEVLRQLVMDSVSVMTRDELERLDLPAAAILRARRRYA